MRSIAWLASWPAVWHGCWLAGQPTSEPASQPTSEPASHPASQQPCQPASQPASQPSNGAHTLTCLRYTYPKLYVFLLHVPCKIDFSEIIVLFLKQKSHISNAFDSFFAPLYKGAKNISKALEIWDVCFKNNTRNSLKSISQGTCNKNTYNLG